MLTVAEFYAPTLLQTNLCVYNVASYCLPRAKQDLPTPLVGLVAFSGNIFLTYFPPDNCELDAQVPASVPPGPGQ